MKFKVVALVLCKFLLVSGSLAQESKPKALAQSICDVQHLDADGLDADNLPNKASRSGEAEVAKEAADQTGWQNLQILYKGFSLAPMHRAPLKEMPFLLPAEGASLASKPKAAPQRVERQPEGFDWDGAFRQSALFLGIQHSMRLAQAKTLEELKGPFFGDYLKAIKGIRGWGDDDGPVTNYLGHPLMGAIGGYIQIHNDRQAKRLELSSSKAYWKSRLKAFAWSAAYSTQFEIGLVSEATLGNVGKRPGTGGYVDFIITPILGTAVIVLEDAADKYIVSRIEKRARNFHVVRLVRTVFNPARTLANLLSFKKPWYRERTAGFAPGGQGGPTTEERSGVK